VLLALMIFYVLVSGFTGSTQFAEDIKANEIPDSKITVDVTHTDGTTDHYDEPYFPTARTGDVIKAYIPLPEDTPYTEVTAIVFEPIYNSSVDLSIGGESVFQYGQEELEAGRQVGSVFVNAVIHPEDWGKTAVLTLTSGTRNAVNQIGAVTFVRANQTHLYLAARNVLDLFITIIIAGTSLLLLFVLVYARHSLTKDQFCYGLAMFSFFIIVALWIQGNQQFIYLFCDNDRVCAMLEYPTAYLVPVAFTAASYFSFGVPRHKRLMHVLAFLFDVSFVVVTVLNYTTAWHYATFINEERVLMIITLIIGVYLSIKETNRNTVIDKAFIQGTIVALILGLIEVIRLMFGTLTPNVNRFLHISFALAGIMVYYLTLVIVYSVKIFLTIEKEKTVRQLAFTDPLTGLLNRGGLRNSFTTLENDKDFTIVFFDADGLKTANDVYGHETGDALLKEIARIISESMAGLGFISRFGGDEFIAVIPHASQEEIKRRLDLFDRNLKEQNALNLLPVELSASYGISVSTADNPKCIGDAIREADDNMYKMKEAHHKARK